MRIRTIARVNDFYYGIVTIGDVTGIMFQRIGDKGWLGKKEKYYSPEAAIAEIKKIEKEYYDAIKTNKRG